MDVDNSSNWESGSVLDKGECETIEVPLFSDNQFFRMLQSDVNNIDALQATEEKSMADEIIRIRDEVSRVSRPAKFSKTDMVRWRAIFELYLDAEVFFATSEQHHGVRTASAALKKLQWFQGEVEKRKLPHNFRLRESHVAFARFLRLNASLLKNLQFQELNQTAVFKILKSLLLHGPTAVAPQAFANSALYRIRQENRTRNFQIFPHRCETPGSHGR